MTKTNYLFEISREVCNKINGVHTVISGKAPLIKEKYGNNFILIGPDVWREKQENPEFSEDNTIFSGWLKQAKSEGLRVRAGRWNIEGKPIVILLDFSNFVSQKDIIFTSFWEKYKLDSLSGKWDYIENTSFGYGAAKVIESFCNYNVSPELKITAHFHDWHSSAGLLYLKYYLPHIATVFTLHSTLLAKTIVEKGHKLYKNLLDTNSFEKASEYDIVSAHSLERISAHTADVFTTTSSFIAEHSKNFLEKEPDVLTINGFRASNIPERDEFDKKRNIAREKLEEIASAVLGKKIDPKAKLMYTSGHYNFYNKGIEVLISTAKKLNDQKKIDREIIIFILIPAYTYGAQQVLSDKLSHISDDPVDNKFLTHELHSVEYDQIYNSIKQNEIKNDKDDKVKIIYAPVFLDGKDGIFNLKYFDLIIGFDSAIFPSYFEPWGFTAVESIALHIPVIMTNLSGIGSYIKEQFDLLPSCVFVVDRNDSNKESVVENISDIISTCMEKTESEMLVAREESYKISKSLEWSKLIDNYMKAYSIGLEKVKSIKSPVAVIPKSTFKQVRTYKSNKPVWRTLTVNPEYSGKFKDLDSLSKNLWWSWNYKAVDLFKYIINDETNSTCIDPIEILKHTTYQRFSELEDDGIFSEKYDEVMSEFNQYMSTPYNDELPKIAYFSMEYGLANIVKIYSGGLGILAGDYLKQASDSRYDMIAVGLFYRQGYFSQRITLHGEQNAVYESQEFTKLPAELVKTENDDILTIQIVFPGRNINAQIWKINVGRITLYLLDGDIEENRKEDRSITYRLYGGDNENRLKQEFLLGIGGIRALKAMNINQDIYHCNEGHAALIGVERMRNLIEEKRLTFNEALEIVRASSLFTTHTPVPAGHDAFSEDLIMTYMRHYPERLKISEQQFINLGKQRQGKQGEKFSMSVLAANTSQEINGVSKLHGDVTKRVIFNKMWDGYFPDELHIGYVTNGVHYPTWTSKYWQELLKNENGEPDFSKVYNQADDKIWEIRLTCKQYLLDFIKTRLDTIRAKRNENPKYIQTVKNKLDKDILTIGFARRFATYKRGNLLFKDLKRLERILNSEDKPVQFIFAGKAHPNDGGGQQIIKEIISYSKRPEFSGRIIFLENYDISVAKQLVQGVDIWLNTPTRPLEASGTSGMKAVMNGVMNLSVLDGWWVEGHKEGAGWALSEKRTYDNQELQNEMDAEVIYQILENEIIPLYYKRNENNIPVEWVQCIKKCVAEIAPEFTTKRMIDHYQERFYSVLEKRINLVNPDNYKLAKEVSSWKEKILAEWDKIDVVNLNISAPIKTPMALGEKYYGELILDLKDINPNCIGVETVIIERVIDGDMKIIKKEELIHEKTESGKTYFKIKISPPGPGNFDYAFRIFAKNKYLPHRQDFCYVKWV